MTTTSEPPSRAFPSEANQYCEILSLSDQARPSDRPLTVLLSTITTPLNQFERIHVGDTFDVMRDAVMRLQRDYCLVFASPDDGFPLGYVARKRLAVELLTGNRPDILRLVTIAPCLPISISVNEALRVLVRKHAQLGVLCNREGAAIGLCTREILLCLAEDRL
jgi:CBS domain containing-hemolysin-like protein